MLCISVAPVSRRLAKADLLNASRHADLIELCLDHLIKEPDVSQMLEGIPKPVLISCRRARDGGHFKASEEARMALLRKAIVAGPAYVELELDIANSIPRFGETKRVISHTSPDRPLENVDTIFEEAYRAKADVVKFAWPTPTLEAAWPLLVAVTKKRALPVVGIGLGPAGLTFSLLGRKYECPWIYAGIEKRMEAHPGQATVWELDEIYSYVEIGPKTRFVGVVGFGDSETAAVRVLNAGFKALDLETRCLPLVIGQFDKLRQMLNILKINSLVISPQLGMHLVEFAKHAVGSAGPSRFADLMLKQSNGWHAYNLIWRSALDALEATLAPQSAEEESLERRSVLLLGTNGVAQSLAHGIQRRQGLLSISGPDNQQAQQLAKKLDARYVPFANLYDTLADVVVITDPSIEMGVKKTQLNPSFLRPQMTVIDLCRLPDETDLLSEARQRGAKIVEPRDILARQVAAQFKAITGRELPVTAVNDVFQVPPSEGGI